MASKAIVAILLFTAGAFYALPIYVYWLLVDGDWLNDYLTHLPALSQPVVVVVGEAVARLILG